MPQASDADRKIYRGMFGDIGCEHGIKYLKKLGYTLEKDWTWTTPKDHTPIGSELFVIDFLINEWDFGGVNL